METIKYSLIFAPQYNTNFYFLYILPVPEEFNVIVEKVN
jgi:hypothetical protein